MARKGNVRELRGIRHNHEVDKLKIARAVHMILEAIGEDPDRPGLIGTPDRIAHAYEELFSGIEKDPAAEINTFFKVDHDQFVVVRDIPFYSMCEHHLLPFIGQAHVAYLPKNGRITGLSKLARAVEVAARRPQIQERLTSQVADAMMERLQARGVAVLVEAEHLCMAMRGIKKPGSRTVTSTVRGVFETDAQARQEAFAMLQRGHSG